MEELEEQLDINDEPDYYECLDAFCAFACSAKDPPRLYEAVELAKNSGVILERLRMLLE